MNVERSYTLFDIDIMIRRSSNSMHTTIFFTFLCLASLHGIEGFQRPHQAVTSTSQQYHFLASRVSCQFHNSNSRLYAQHENEAADQNKETTDDIDKFRTLMGNLYLGAGIAHAIDCFVGPSALITSAGSPPYQQLPVEGQALVGLWCFAGPLAFWLARVGVSKEETGGSLEELNAADVGLILYGIVEVVGSYFLPEKSSFGKAIFVQGIVLAAWMYSNRNTGEVVDDI